ncbi:alpha/beta-hydrolase [Exidia glandulosa HHB12029]|uniref:Alpha/beta-hydrolase n=1 Tax=Exidia glandulosa HHB12029 TaxID=1314781 RepID=A0A165B7I7_EXIGL|nr:alpha/beta-hydrolase [Exidia glandulosa HHB12029]
MALSLYGRLRVYAYFAIMNVLIRLWKRKGLPRRGILPPDANIDPTITGLNVQSSVSRRKITINVFYPPGRMPGDGGENLPVHLNIHGSGFCLDVFPTEAEFSAYIALNAHCVVIDTDYAKAPHNPYPAAYHDVSDVVQYIREHPSGDWDLSRLTIGGTSSGGALALAVAAQLPKGVLKSVTTFYPLVDVVAATNEESIRVRKIPEGGIGHPLDLWERSRMMEGYSLNVVDFEDPRFSPVHAPAEAFPPVTIITGDCDPLFPGMQALAKKLRAAGNDYEEMIIVDAGHGWERMVTPGDTRWEKLRDEALSYFVSRIRKSWST